jgi:hypothetical protein
MYTSNVVTFSVLRGFMKPFVLVSQRENNEHNFPPYYSLKTCKTVFTTVDVRMTY